MKTVVPKAVWQAALIGISLVSAVFCQTKTDQEFGITGPGTGTNIMGGVYTDPYQGWTGATPKPGTNGTAVYTNSSGTPTTGSPISAFCDDFTNEVTPPQFWNADETNLDAFSKTNSADVSTVYYGSNGTANSSTALTPQQQTIDYVAVAMLAVQSMADGAGNQLAQEQLSFALWDIFDPTVLANDCSGYACLDSGANSGTADTPSGTPNWYAAYHDAMNALNAATAFVAANPGSSGGAYENSVGMDIEIYSEASANGTVDTSSGRPQEFVTVQSSGTNFNPTPEPSMLAFLGFDGVGLGIIGLYFRRRQLRSQA